MEPHFFAIRRHLVFTFCVFRDIFLYDTHLPSIWMWLQCALRRFMGSPTIVYKGTPAWASRARRASTRARAAPVAAFLCVSWALKLQAGGHATHASPSCHAMVHSYDGYYGQRRRNALR